MQIKNKNGFSLVELMTVVAVIGVMALFAIPQLTNVKPNMQLKAVARDLYSNMQKSRMIAVKSNRSTAIIFDTGNGQYEICEDWDNADTTTTPPGCGGTIIDFSNMKYGIGYGHGSATSSIGASFSDNVSYSSPVNVVTFNSQGLGNAGYVYLDHNDSTKTYAIGSQTSGVIKLLKWNAVAGGWE